MSNKRLVLGLELSTQSAKWVTLNVESAEAEQFGSIAYDTRFPAYKTEGGVLPSSNPQERTSPPGMFLEALDAVFEDMKSHGVELAAIEAIKCDAQQHATVYLGSDFARCLETAGGASSLVDHFIGCVTREKSPIWEDRTTQQEALALENALAEAGGIRRVTGNRAELRFPAAQILRWAAKNPAEYDRTAHILLLSAFITSVLSGRIAPVDTGDGWGSNINSIDIQNPDFSSRALRALAGLIDSTQNPEDSSVEALKSKVGAMCAYDTPVGTVGDYFVHKYGVRDSAVVLSGTGDNPATLLGCGDGALISLGSSYTVCGPMADIQPAEDDSYNVFGYRPGLAMALSVITNGGKLHTLFCDTYADGDWSRYAQRAGQATVSPDTEPLMLPYLSDESVPVARAGIVRSGFDDQDSAANVRSLHLSQVASLRLHSRHLSSVDRICVVGGGARNSFIREAIAHAFNAETYSIDHADLAAPFGCAVSAARHVLGIDYEEATRRFVRTSTGGSVKPDGTEHKRFLDLVARYSELEESARQA